MSRAGFDAKTTLHVPVAHPFYDSGRHEGQDERDSLSGSDDGNYIYHDVSKNDFDHDDDHTALTSQTLNTDGTPKRPMNAFMIFARRRRPQVSAENQAMRTGEISKILSKEWNNMETSQKQFYQEQARQLKDSFNNKYPDYVYRRRPNNSRRKRKPDVPGQRPLDRRGSLDDIGLDDGGDSPTDGEEHLPEVMSDPHRPRLSHDDHPKFRQPTSRASPYSYPSHDPRTTSISEHHIAYDSMGDGERPLSDGLPQQNYSYLPTQIYGRPTQAQNMPIYNQNSLNGNDNWNLPSRSWLGSEPSQGRNYTSLSAQKTHRSPSSPSWHRSAHPAGNTVATSNLTLPTLSSPFYPDSSQPLSPQGHPHSITPPYGSSHMQSPSLVSREFSHHDISLSPPLPDPVDSYHASTDRNGLVYAPRQSGVARGLPSISGYSQLQPPPLSPHSAIGIQHGYWSKD